MKAETVLVKEIVPFYIAQFALSKVGHEIDKETLLSHALINTGSLLRNDGKCWRVSSKTISNLCFKGYLDASGLVPNDHILFDVVDGRPCLKKVSDCERWELEEQ